MNDEYQSVGLIGVGLLGTAIAERLLDSGRQVWAYDVRAEQLDPVMAASGIACTSATEVLSHCDEVILSLPDSHVVRGVLLAHRGALRRGQVVVDTTTGDPEEMTGISETLRAAGVAYVEATVAGSSEQVRSGQACLFVGGDVQTVQRIQSLLRVIAPRHYHLGAAGAASRFKLVHNLVLGLNRAALAEGLSLAGVFGFDPARVVEILRETPAASRVLDIKGAKMVSGDFTPQARLSQHLKDVRLIVAAAGRAGLDTPLSRAHQQLLERADSLGFGEADNSAVIEAYRQSPGEAP